MRILFEEYQYEPHLLGDIVKDITGIEQNIEDKKIRLGYVGYFYSSAVNDCVFILPKVLLNEKEEIAYTKDVNGNPIRPEQIIEPEGQMLLGNEYCKFLYEFAVWIYRSIDMYRKHNSTDAVYTEQIPEEGPGKCHEARTYLDIILSLIRFNRENPDYFMFIAKNMHSGNNKINWTRTIAKSQAIVQDDNSVIYCDAVNKKRQINFDEELFVIFFSILNYLNNQYGFRTPINCNYNLITGKAFESYNNGRGKRRLMQIKYKYFSDKALQLWNICYAFFDSSYRIRVNTKQKEYLLVRKFEHVFEAMIDELIGTPHNDIPKGLADQDDGKRVDHMYAYQSLTSNSENEDVYYIGDSKYYKSGHKLGKESIYKQYTYARNVIQWNINLFNGTEGMDAEEKSAWLSDSNNFSKINLRKDSTTEGYNIIPNFFLSAYVNKDRQKDDGHENIIPHRNKANPEGNANASSSTYISYQFKNRLFDRDTLILSHYDVNFLYVIYLYARNKPSEKKIWRDKVHLLFRDEIRNVLKEKYSFYAMQAHPNVDAKIYLKEHFQQTLGKIYTPFDNDEIFSLALDKNDPDGNNEDLLTELRKYFFVVDNAIGENPVPALTKKIEQDGEMYNTPLDKQGVLLVMMENFTNKCVKFLPNGKIAIGIKYSKDSMSIVEHLSEIGYILFHTRNDEGQHLFAINGDISVNEAKELDNDIYKNVNTTEIYAVVKFNNSELNSSNIHSGKKTYTPTTRYDAQFELITNLQ